MYLSPLYLFPMGPWWFLRKPFYPKYSVVVLKRCLSLLFLRNWVICLHSTASAIFIHFSKYSTVQEQTKAMCPYIPYHSPCTTPPGPTWWVAATIHHCTITILMLMCGRTNMTLFQLPTLTAGMGDSRGTSWLVSFSNLLMRVHYRQIQSNQL